MNTQASTELKPQPPEYALLVTAADFNGQSFDGRPLVPVGSNADLHADVKWVSEALDSGELVVGTPGHTDYAEFGVKNEAGETVWAGPGDYLVYEDNKVQVVKKADWMH